MTKAFFQKSIMMVLSMILLWTVVPEKAVGQTGGCPSCPPMIAYFQSVVPASCGECDGMINLCVVGQAPFTFSWSGPNGFTASTEDLDNLCPGTYIVTITDANGNIKVLSVEITEDCFCTLWGDVQWDPITCDGPGTAIAQGYDGTPPYKYKWDNGATTQSIIVTQSGWHSVTITDSGIGDCESVHYVFFDTPGASVNVTASPSVICQGGSTLLKAFASGNAPFMYQWSNGVVSQQQWVSPGTTTTYSVTVTDADGCTSTKNVLVTVNQPPTVTITGPTVLCAGQTATLTATGTNGATYTWSTGQTGPSIVVNPGTTSTYSVTATKNGCTATDVHEIHVSVTSDSIIWGQPETICSDSSFVRTVIDSTAFGNACDRILYQHVLTAVAYNDIIVWGQPETICSDSSFVRTVIDSTAFGNACDRILYQHVLTGVLTINVTGTVENITCNGANDGEISLTFSTSDSIDVFWSNGQIDATITNLSAGTYSVTVTTVSGCETTETFIITEPFPLVLTSTVNNPTCFGLNNGLIDALVEGGTSPYQYNWSNGSQDHLQQDLISDAYSVTVTDANGCTTGTSFQLIQPDSISISAVLQPTSCEGLPSGAIDLTVSGGSGNFSYNWNDFFSMEDRINLLGGSYGVTVTDANGCTADSVFHIKENGCHVWYSHGELHVIIGRCGELPTFDFEVKVYDTNGREVKSFSGTATNGYFDGSFNVSDLATGLYSVTVIGENDEVRHGSRFFKQ